MVDQFLRFFQCAAVVVFGEYGDECLRECTFRKQPAQQVGNAKRYEKRVGCDACTEDTGNQHVPDKSEDAGYQRHPADGGEGFKQIHGAGMLT